MPASPPAADAMTRRISSPLLIGRDAELDAVSADLDMAAGGRLSVVLVGGEAGIGKTRLALAVAELAVARGFREVRGGCTPLNTGAIPYGAFGTALEAVALALEPGELSEVLAADAPLIARIAPRVAELLGEPPGSMRASRPRLLEAVAAVFRRLAARGPVLLTIEDLQWADVDSLDVLSCVVSAVDRFSIAILLTFRSEEVSRHARLEAAFAELDRRVGVDRIELGRFAGEETGRLIEAIRGARPTARMVDSIQRRSGGNPFFIEELLQAAGDPAAVDGARQLPIEVVADRLDSAPAGIRRTLGPLAAGGSAVDIDFLAAVTGSARQHLDDSLREAITHGLVIVDHDGTRDRVRFRHELMRETAYERLLAPERRSLHRAFAEAMSAAAADGHTDAGLRAVLAHHWVLAGEDERALPAAIRAAEDAEHAFAFGAALLHYEHALAAWERVDDPVALAGCERLELLRRAGSAAFLSGAGDADLALRRQAVDEAERTGDFEQSVVTLAELGHSLWAVGKAADSENAFRAAEALMPAEPPSVGRARALAVLGQVLMNTGRHRESLVLCREALAIAIALGDRSVECHASNSMGVAMGYLGRDAEAVAALERSREIALDMGDPDEIGRAYLNESEILTICGQRRRALELVDEGIARCRDLGIHVAYGEGICLHGSIAAFELGDWVRAAGYAAEWTNDLASPNDELYQLAHTVELGVAQGAWEATAARLARMTVLLMGYPVDLQYTGPWACARAELAIWRAEPADALGAVRAGLARLERTDDVLFRSRLLRLGIRAAADLADIARARRDRQLEDKAIDQADEVRRRVLAILDVAALAQGGLALELEVARAEADAEQARLRRVAIPDAWRRVADDWARLERPYPEGYARLREAESHLVRHDRSAAHAALRRAAEVAVALGAAPLAREIAALGRRSRVGSTRSPARADEPRPFGLTPREMEVLELLGQGLTDQQIGEGLFISHYTASAHVSHILAKLGVRSRTEAAGNAYRLGVIPRQGDVFRGVAYRAPGARDSDSSG